MNNTHKCMYEPSILAQENLLLLQIPLPIVIATGRVEEVIEMSKYENRKI